MIIEGCLDLNPECCRSKLARYRLIATHPSNIYMHVRKNIRQPTLKQGSIDVFCVRLVDRSRTISLLIENGFFTLRIIPKLFSRRFVTYIRNRVWCFLNTRENNLFLFGKWQKIQSSKGGER
jgi:hypothetical protein